MRFANLSTLPLLLICLCNAAFAQTLPMQEDAALYDVQFVGSRSGWAVGDHGVIWHTTDGGESWDFVPSPVDCPLRSICFLTDRVGWIAGGGTTRHTRLGYGVVLFTDNAGESWRIVARDTVPPLYAIKFFGLEQGIAVGEATQEHPTGLLATSDGGKTWQPLLGERHRGWRAAAFVQPEVGVLAGLRGQVKLFGGGRFLASQSGTQGLQNIRAVTLDHDDRGWLAGDGGLIRQTENGGVSWRPPTGKLPDEAERLIDFRAAAQKGNHVWLAGNPGSVVWHSPDGGKTWRKQLTGQTAPILSLHFASETAGWAVGAMGAILKTDDGGQTWQAVRGNGRRAALLVLSTRPSRVPYSLLTKLSGDEGYRSAVYLPARRDIGFASEDFADLDARLSESVAIAGGSFAETGWQLPVAIPGLEHHSQRLQADWNARTENKFASVFMDDLVKQIRTWRPDVIVLDAASEDDALSKLIYDATMLAAERAADPTLHIAQQEHAGLGPWVVKKIYRGLPEGSVGDANVDRHEYLPRRKTAISSAAAEARSLIQPLDNDRHSRDAYRLVHFVPPSQNREHLRDFFAGLSIAPDSAARRALRPIDPQQDAERRAVIQKQRNFHAYAERMISDPRHAAQLIGQLRQITEGMTEREAALELARLAEDYRQQSRWDLVESTLVELVEKHPDEPVAHEAMRWLFQLWNAAEPAWQRSKKPAVTRGSIRTDVAAIQERIDRAIARAASREIQLAEYERPDTGPDPVQVLSNPGELQITKDKNWRTGTIANWQEQAARIAGLIRQKSPNLFLEPEIQFPLAVLMRQKGVFRLSDSYYRRFQRLGDEDLWKKNAAAELWLTNPLAEPPKPIVHSLNTNQRPHLDGVLSETCWQAAKILELENPQQEASGGAADTAFVMLSYDEEFLYIAASIPRAVHVPVDGVQLGGREHDADLSRFDRIAIALDVDRDYATWYTLEIDQRGWTRDRCWDDQGWNPKWYVAAEADDKRWRVEAAIPFTELVPESPKPGATWAVGISRIMPAVGSQSWPASESAKPRPETFGLIRFQ